MRQAGTPEQTAEAALFYLTSTSNCHERVFARQWVDVTADAYFILYIAARTMEDYEQFTPLFVIRTHIKLIQKQVIVDRAKAGFAIPIESPSED